MRKDSSGHAWRKSGGRHMVWMTSGYHRKDGSFEEFAPSAGEVDGQVEVAGPDGFQVIEVVCTVTHFPDHDPANCQGEILRLWCQHRPHAQAVARTSSADESRTHHHPARAAPLPCPDRRPPPPITSLAKQPLREGGQAARSPPIRC